MCQVARETDISMQKGRRDVRGGGVDRKGAKCRG